jgi:VanZ family protein
MSKWANLQISKWVNGPVGRWGAVVAWMALIFILSAQSQLPTPGEDWLDFIIEKSAHTFEFAVLGALSLRALTAGRMPGRRALGVAVLLAWLYALADEFHQRYVPGRSADWTDILFDWSGALIGAWLWLRWRVGRGGTERFRTQIDADKRRF